MKGYTALILLIVRADAALKITMWLKKMRRNIGNEESNAKAVFTPNNGLERDWDRRAMSNAFQATSSVQKFYR
jgi:hypothetical protein